MHINVITPFPDAITAHMGMSIMKRAVEKNAVTVNCVDPRNFATDSYGTIDDHPYGGGAGMLMRVDVAHAALQSIKNPGKVLLMSARGKQYTQVMARDFAKEQAITIIAPHYEGIDERIMKYVDESVAIGEYVLTSGTLAATVVIDSIVRLLPGVLKKEIATVDESFSEEGVLEYPQYTRPDIYDGNQVPEVLLSGNHAVIAKWQKENKIFRK